MFNIFFKTFPSCGTINEFKCLFEEGLSSHGHLERLLSRNSKFGERFSSQGSKEL